MEGEVEVEGDGKEEGKDEEKRGGAGYFVLCEERVADGGEGRKRERS